MINRRKFLEATIAAGLSIPTTVLGQQVVYTSEHLLKREFDQREAQWRENVLRSQQSREPVNYTSIPLSDQYDLNDLIAVLGGEWDAMPQDRKNIAFRSWNKTIPENRKTICGIYNNPFTHFQQRLTPTQQAQFNDFNAAATYTTKNFPNPSVLLFATRDGSTTEYVRRHYPWIWLDQMTVPDRMVVFSQGYIENPNAIKIDFPSVLKYAEQAFKNR